MSRLQHPSVVKVFDYGNLPAGAAFLVMEFVRGADLRHVLRREPMLSPERTIELITGVTLGVEAAQPGRCPPSRFEADNLLLAANAAARSCSILGVAKIIETSSDDGGTLTGGHTHRRHADVHGAGTTARSCARAP